MKALLASRIAQHRIRPLPILISHAVHVFSLMTVATIDSREARTQWRTILDTAGTTDIVITRYGKPVATLIGYEDWLAVQEKLDDLRSARCAVEAVEDWKKDPSTAKPLSVFKAELPGLRTGMLSYSGNRAYQG